VTRLTAAVLAAVNDADFGEASVINDAASRVGGVIVIALVPVLIGAIGGRRLAHAASLSGGNHTSIRSGNEPSELCMPPLQPLCLPPNARRDCSGKPSS